MPKVALSMIVSGDETKEVLNRALDSIIPYIDAAYVTITTKDKNDLKGLCESKKVVVDYAPGQFHKEATSKDIKWLTDYLDHKPLVKRGEKLFQFDKARNHNLNQIAEEYDWIVWMDVDDVFRGSENLKKVIDVADKNGAEAIFMNYIYQAEIEDGKIKNVIIEHLRERAVKRMFFEWVAPIHETLIEKKPTVKVDTQDCDVLHLSNKERMLSALERNIKTLELSVCQTKGEDPRPVYYLGKAYFDVATHKNKEEFFKRAQTLFAKYLFGTKEHDFNNRSGWPEERAQCWEYQMEIHRHFDEHEQSVLCGLNALKESEQFPSTYINIAMSYLCLGQFDRAIFWVKLASKIPQPQSTLVNSPKDIQGRALEILYNAKIQTSQLDDAWAAAVKLHNLHPQNPEMQERLKFVEGLKTQRDLTKSISEIAQYHKQFGSKDKLLALVNAIPTKLAENPIMAKLIKEVLPPRTWEKDEIALFCGPGYSPWNPDILKNPGQNFIGGSEEAVIHLAEELGELGWKVTVYNDPGKEGMYGNVNYQPYFKFNQADKFNIFISWRQPQLADANMDCQKFYVWCHDIQRPLEYTEERLEKIEKVIVLSPWHRKNIHNVPDEKILISSNGVDL